jgi:DNA-binding MarR family transcriptional regulator
LRRLWELKRTSISVVDLQMAREHGMRRAQWIILARLEGQPDLSQNELAALAEVAGMPASRLVDRREGLGLVKCHTDPEVDASGGCD